MPGQGINLAEVELPKETENEIICPYFQQRCDGKDKISHHIDNSYLLYCS
jgi:hypothetical protein